MANNYKIEVVDESVIKRVPEHLKINGRVFLVPDSAELSITRELSETDEFNTVEGSDFVKANFVFTPVNDIVFQDIRKAVPVIVHTKSGVRERTAHVKRKNFKSKRYEMFFVDDNDPIEFLKRTRICDIDLGTFEWTIPNLLAQMQNAAYQDGTQGIWTPLAYHGSFIDDNGTDPIIVRAEDMRLRFSPLWILQKALESIGWCFRSPVMETDFGRRQWRYLYKSDWWEHQGHGEQFGFAAELGVDTGISTANILNTGWMPLDTIVSGTAAIIETIAGQTTATFDSNYHRGITGCFRLTGQLRNDSDASGDITIYMVNQMAISNVSDRVVLNAAIGEVIDIDLEFNTVPFRFAAVQVQTGTGWTALAGLRLTFAAKDKFHYQGDTIPLNEVVDCDKFLMDILKSELHWFSGILDIDEADRVMTASPPYHAVVHGESVRGYYGNLHEAVELPGLIRDCSIIENPSVSKSPRSLELRWADVEDDYIAQKIEDGAIGENPYGFNIEFEVLNKKKEKKDNCCYSPTLTGGIPLRQDLNPVSSIMIEGDGAPSLIISPRATLGYWGEVRVGGVAVEWDFEGNTLASVPFEFMSVPDNVDLPLGNNNWTLDFNHLYTLFFREKMLKIGKGLVVKLEYRMDESAFSRLDFGEYVCVTIEGTQYVYRIEEGRWANGIAKLKGVAESC